jgi:hypothetical protein
MPLPSGFVATVPSMLALAWTSGLGLILAIAAAVTTIGGALVLILGGAQKLKAFVSPPKPLVSFGHPSEQHLPMITWLPADPEVIARQETAHEQARLESLAISYLVENRDVALRELSTGIRTRDGAQEHTFGEHFVQILPGGDTTEVTDVSVPSELHEGMTDENRALNFIYWARFEREGKRWEASYDPQTRKLRYRRLRF